MSIPKSSKLFLLIFIFFIIIFFELSTYVQCMHQNTEMIDDCLTQVCSYNDPTTRYVHFPFLIRNDSIPRSCGYPGFDLFCDGVDKMLIDLPNNAGVFSVQAIDYDNQELWLNDPDNCLPKRLLSHNLTKSKNSPFFAVEEQVYWLYNCSHDFLETLPYMKPIGCLSGPSYGVVATHSEMINGNVSCGKVGSIRVPVGSRLEALEGYYSDLSSDIRLGWVNPECGECYQRGGQCGFKSSSSLEVDCFNLPRRGLAKNAVVAIALAFAAPLALLAFCITYFIVKAVCYRARRRDRDSSDQGVNFAPSVAPQMVANGLDQSIIESYPKVVLGESRRLPKADDKSCPICLGEYLPKETLRTLPHCGHCFHAECVDEWLLLNASCPVCRKSPSQCIVEHTD